MRVTVYVPTRSALKLLGSTMDAAMAKGYALQVLCDEGSKEPVQAGDVQRWAAAQWEGPPTKGRTVGLAGDARAEVGVCSWWDNYLQPPVAGQRVGYLSAWHKHHHARLFPAWRGWIEQQPCVGFTIADHRVLVRRESIPTARHAVLFSMKRRVRGRRSLRMRRWYYQQVRHAERLAHTFGLPLRIKTRTKHADPWWLGLMGTLVEDESMYPSTSMQLLAQADWAMHFMSGAALEARLHPACVLMTRQVSLDYLAHLPGVIATYAHMLRDPLEQVITYDDTHAGERVLEMLR